MLVEATWPTALPSTLQSMLAIRGTSTSPVAGLISELP